MSKSRFVYSVEIRTTAEKLWAALTEPEWTRRYWVGTSQVSDWKVGSEWKLMIPDGRVGDSGVILESDPPRRLVMTWSNQFVPSMQEDVPSKCTYELEPMGDVVRLTVVHESELEDSKLITAVSNGWPKILESLKSLLETGEPTPGTSEWPAGM